MIKNMITYDCKFLLFLIYDCIYIYIYVCVCQTILYFSFLRPTPWFWGETLLVRVVHPTWWWPRQEKVGL